MANFDIFTTTDADAAVVSGTTIIDMQGAESLMFIANVINTTSFAVTHGNDSGLSDGAAVDAAFLIGPTAYTATGTGRVCYVGKKRYVQITVTNPATDVTIVALKGNLLNSVPVP